MKSRLRWALIISQVGGGFTGIVITLDYLFNSRNTPLPVLFISMGFIVLYAFVTIAGALFALDERRTWPLRTALWLQIPWISSSIMAWRFTSGLSITVTLIGGGLSMNFWLGSIWQFNLFEKLPPGVGINLFAMLMLLLLRRTRDPQVGTMPSMAVQIDSILQRLLLNTPLQDRNIQLQSLPKGSLSIKVGTNQYPSVDDVPEEEIRLVIRSAIAEWESRGPA